MNNVTFMILEAICCLKLESLVNEIASNGSDVAIVFIICLTVCVTLLTICFKMFSYLKERHSSETNNKAIKDLKKQIDDLREEVDKLLEENNNKEKKCPLPPEQKEGNRFLDFCYDMAKSTEVNNLHIKKECWDILKNRQNVTSNAQKGNGN